MYKICSGVEDFPENKGEISDPLFSAMEVFFFNVSGN